MFFRFLLLVCLLFTGDAIAASTPSNVIVLSDTNTIVMRDPITDDSVSKLINQLVEKDAKLPVGQPIYLYIDSPGGSIDAGLQFIDAVKGLGREVKTVTAFAASMAFITVQNLGERIVMPHGVLMSHRAKGGVEGQMPGELDTRYYFNKKYVKDAIKEVAARLGLTPEQLEKKHYDEWWMEGQDAVDQKAADKVALVKCDKSMRGTYTTDVMTFFGPLTVTFAKCPLARAPLKIEPKAMPGLSPPFKGGKNDLGSDDWFVNREKFLRDYILTGKMQ